MWGEQAAEATVGAVHAYVSRLRRLFGHDALPRHATATCSTVTWSRSTPTSSSPTSTWAGARWPAVTTRTPRRCSRCAGPLERPSAFGGDAAGPMPFLAPVAARLEELRVVAAEALADAHARQGRAADDVALLEELAARDPLRESVTVRLVRALYAAGRQADALAAFDRCRGALADELGVQPTPALRQVRAAVLAHQPLPGVARLVRPRTCRRGTAPSSGRRACSRPSTRARRRHPPSAGRRADRAGGRRQDGARARAGPPAAPARPRRLVDLRRRPGRTGHRPRRARHRAGHRPVRARRGRAGGAVGGTGPHSRLVAGLRQRRRARLIESFLPAARHGDVIVTSRNPAWRRLARPVAVGPLARGESLTYVATRVGDRPAEAGTLADLLGDLPLALEQACAYLEQTGCRARLRRPVPPPPRGPAAARCRRLGPHRRDDVGPGVRPARGAVAAGDRAARDDRLPRPGRDRRGDPAPARAGRAGAARGAGELLRLSLVDREADDVRVHRLVQDVVRARMKPDARAAPARRVAVRVCLTQAWVRGPAATHRRAHHAPRGARRSRRGARHRAGRAVEALRRSRPAGGPSAVPRGRAPAPGRVAVARRPRAVPRCGAG